jgi:hypothetical protein
MVFIFYSDEITVDVYSDEITVDHGFFRWVGLRGGWVGLRVGFININDMYNNDIGKWGAQGCEAYEVKQRVALVRVSFYFINLLPTSLVYISILLAKPA